MARVSHIPAPSSDVPPIAQRGLDLRRCPLSLFLGGTWGADYGFHPRDNFAGLAVTNGSGACKQREYSVVGDPNIHPLGRGEIGF